MKKQGKKFKIAYIIYVVLLLVIAAAAVFYVISVLKDYESYQPEREIERQIKNIAELAGGGSVDSIVSYGDDAFEIDSEEKARLASALAKENLSYKIKGGSSDGSSLTYSIADGEETLLYIKLKSVSETTKLSLFTYSVWETEEITAALSHYTLSLPPSVKVTLNGKELTGTVSEEEPNKLVYNISAFGSPRLSVSDITGNVLDCAGTEKIDISEYKITVPDNFSLKIGGREVSPEIAQKTENPTYVNVSEYCGDMPELLVYDCGVLGKNPEIEIFDPMGNAVEYDMDGNTVLITEQPSYSDNPPEELTAQIDPMRAAKDWSLFLTQDLSGAYYGFYTLAQYLAEGSYLYDVAWKYANGMDITFTSVHSYPSFSDEKLTNYIRYTENCFSCDIFFNKHMDLNSGSHVVDTMNSRFYFVNNGTAEAPNWIIADIREII